MVEKRQSTKKNTAVPTKKSLAKPKKPLAKKITPAAKKTRVKKVAMVPQKSVAKKGQPKKKNLDDTGILVEAALNIEAGAKSVSKYASNVAKDVADRTSQVAEDMMKKTKKGIRDVYDIGGKAVDDLQDTAQEYIERFKNSVEMKKASKARQKLVISLGNIVFTKFQSKRFKPEILVKEEQVLSLVNEIQLLDKKIVKLGKKLEKK